MKFVKSFIISLIVVGLTFGIGFANPGSGNHWGTDWNSGNHYGWGNGEPGTPNYDNEDFAVGVGCVDTTSFDYGVEYGVTVLKRSPHSKPTGIAGGIGGAIGSGEAAASGFINETGSFDLDVSSVGGGMSFHENGVVHNPVHNADRSIGVYSTTSTESATGGSVYAKVDPGMGWTALGGAEGHMSGFTAQGSIDGSVVKNARDWNSTGFTSGVAAQGSTGGFEGGVVVGSGSDLPGFPELVYVGNKTGLGKIFDFDNWITIPGCPIDSFGEAGVSAGIEMFGGSTSFSYRFVDENGPYRTEGMGTEVSSITGVRSYKNIMTDRGGLGFATGSVDGGFIAGGGATSLTVQKTNNGTSVAKAAGFYAGGGSLGSNFLGTANGYTATSVTTKAGYTGSIQTSNAGMNVSVNNPTHGGNQGPQ